MEDSLIGEQENLAFDIMQPRYSIYITNPT